MKSYVTQHKCHVHVNIQNVPYTKMFFFLIMIGRLTCCEEAKTMYSSINSLCQKPFSDVSKYFFLSFQGIKPTCQKLIRRNKSPKKLVQTELVKRRIYSMQSKRHEPIVHLVHFFSAT